MTVVTSLLETAIAIARKAHAGQVDKSGAPYIEHPIRVMNALPTDDVPARILAVLHDVLEDTAVTREQLLAAGFSETLLVALDCLTHAPGEPDDVYWSRIAENPLAIRVKRADIADNSNENRLTHLPPDVAERLRDKYRRALSVLDSVRRS